MTNSKTEQGTICLARRFKADTTPAWQPIGEDPYGRIVTQRRSLIFRRTGERRFLAARLRLNSSSTVKGTAGNGRHDRDGG